MKSFRLVSVGSFFCLVLVALVSAARAELPSDTFPLWPAGEVPLAKATGEPDTPTLTPYPADDPTGAIFIVCPGGGYGGLAPHEGKPIAEWLNSVGVTSFVLRYRHAPDYGHPAPLMDIQRAIRTVRAHSEEWGLDPERVGILGFSAGGHLVTTAATHFDAGDDDAKDPIDRWSSRPDVVVPVYPVVSMTDVGHAGSRRNLLGKDPDPQLVEYLSNEKQVTSQTPPTFLVHSVDDKAVPVENSLLFASALREAGVPFEMHIYESGPHGFGLGKNDPALSSWPRRCADWLRRHKFAR